MKYRNYFIMFSIGFAVAISMLYPVMALINYLFFAISMLVLAISYLIAIVRDTWR